MSFNTQVIDLLDGKTMSTNDIHRNIGMSLNYVRTQLRLMESAGLIERVDDRTPVIYKLTETNPAVKYRERVGNAKKALLAPPEQTETDPILTAIKSMPKEQWEPWADKLQVLGLALKELNEEGKLIDIL